MCVIVLMTAAYAQKKDSDSYAHQSSHLLRLAAPNFSIKMTE